MGIDTLAAFPRYLYEHRYNFTLPDLIDMIDSPVVKQFMEEWTYKDLSAWPTPQVPDCLVSNRIRLGFWSHCSQCAAVSWTTMDEYFICALQEYLHMVGTGELDPSLQTFLLTCDMHTEAPLTHTPWSIIEHSNIIEWTQCTDAVIPKITQLWVDYFDNLGFDIIVAPTTAITARAIDASEPYSEINSRVEVGRELDSC